METEVKIKNEFPLVSICSTTYNLELYIAQALDSWLEQESDFDFEIVICDDKSSDKTIEIIQAYQVKFPNKIRLIEAEKNLGMLPNFIKSLEAAKGKYIAVCDGDDYWIDSKKLQKQVDFLEQNSDFSTCYMNSLVKNETTGEEKVAKTQIWDEANSEDLLLHDDFHPDNIHLSPGHISAFIFRNNVFEKFPTWFYKVDGVTDFPLFMMLSKFGKAKFINEVTSVYRMHEKSTSIVQFDYLRFHRGRIFMYKNVNVFLEHKFSRQIFPLIAKHYLKIAKIYRQKRQYLKLFLNLCRVAYYDLNQLTKRKK